MNYECQEIADIFQQKFNRQAQYVCRAPGRVNLIGGHTDYNDGFVLPMAINRAIYLVISPRQDRHIQLLSMNFDRDKMYHIAIDKLNQHDKKSNDWDEYVKGMAWAIQQHYQQALTGFDAIVFGNVPIGAGLSSSAAFEMAIGRAFAISNDLEWQPTMMAQLGQKTENQWVGVNCGIMDQMIAVLGKKDHAVLIDCRSLDHEIVPLPQGTAAVIMDTSTRRGLIDSAYNDRRQSCEQVAKLAGVKALRDLTIDELKQLKSKIDQQHSGIDANAYRRAYHIINENERVLQAKAAMKNQDAITLGKLISTSHQSLRDDLEVSSDKLNIMVELAQQHPNCYGARMTGAGFGGCAVALIDYWQAEAFVSHVSTAYQQQTNLKANLYVCTAVNGSEVINIEEVLGIK